METTPRDARIGELFRCFATVLAPTLLTGVIKRRPGAMALAQRLHLDRLAVRSLDRMRLRHGSAPVRLRALGRSAVLVLDPRDVGTLLAEGPRPLHPASAEKRAALRHFQPHGVLVSAGPERAERRRFNEEVLEPGRELHACADTFAPKVHQEATQAAGLAARTGELDWAGFNDAWWRAVRRVVLGDGARDDHRLTDELATLREHANWAWLHPRDRSLRRRFEARLRAHVRAAEPGSLAAASGSGADPAGQIPHWLFAFDAAGMVTMRALAVLATHPAHAAAAREELDQARGRTAALPFLRACVLDTVRLWPTTPLLLRETDRPIEWGETTLPAGTNFPIFTPLFHRDPAALPYADEFRPEIWLDGRAAEQPALVPFSAGPAACPGRDLVLFVTATMLAGLLEGYDYRLLDGPRLREGEPLPATLDNFGVRLGPTPR